ncbi:MAG: hypothetical protein K1X92_14440 [Bacteroidia bacterium]|nr:hypothetical protein [Bacteroidia bacterium]
MAVFVEIFPASYGDCFLVRLESEDSKPYHILIDGGKICGNPHKNKLIERLQQIQSLDLLIVTHIDDDHIEGIIELLEQNENDSIVHIKEIWFNGFRHIHYYIGDTQGLSQDHINRLDKILAHRKSKQDTNGIKEISADTAHNTLTPLIMQRNLPWNQRFLGETVIMEKDMETNQARKYELRKDISIQILTPTKEILMELDNFWLKALNSKNTKYNEVEDEILTKAVEYLLAQTEEEVESNQIKTVSAVTNDIEYYYSLNETKNTTINNRSSISFILEFYDKKLLFLGDAAADDILSCLGKDTNHHFDLIKVSHHGSKTYTSKALLEIVDADNFIISTNGKRYKQHPDMECIAKIVYRPTESKRNLIFNYPSVSAYQLMQNSEWGNTYKYELYSTIEGEINTIEI